MQEAIDMVKRFEHTALDRSLIEKALARIDARRVRARKAKHAAAMQLRKRRQRERNIERREANRREAVLWPKWGTNEARRILPLAGWKVLAARMASGEWFDMHQLRDLMPEYARKSVRAWIKQKLVDRAVAEKAGNPDYDDSIPQGSQWACRYLYRLTDEGMRLAAEWRSEIGE